MSLETSKKPLITAIEKYPNVEFTGFPLHLTVLSVHSQIDHAMKTLEASGGVWSSEVDLYLGWCIGLKRLSCSATTGVCHSH